MNDYTLWPVVLRPGINKQSTQYGAKGTWYDADKVRFRDGLPETIRGWQKKSSDQFLGTARAIHGWNDAIGAKYIAWGTEAKLYVHDGGNITDITPVTTSVSASNFLSTTANSTRVVVSVNLHSAATNDYVAVTSMLASIGDDVLLDGGSYLVSLIDANSFAIESATSAAATSISTGNAHIDFLLATGNANAVFGFGYGSGTYGVSAYGDARSTSNFVLAMRQWSLDNFGLNLVACPRGGRIYTWDTSLGVDHRATLISASPSVNDFILVSPESRHLLSFGTNDPVGGDYDPLLVRWSDTENYNVWTPAVTNAAGSWHIGGGNKIVGAVRSRSQTLIWTDFALHGMAYTGPPYTFGFRELGTHCGLLGPHAATDYSGRVFWMGERQFFVYDGRVRPLDCTVLREVFDDINLTQRDKIFAGTNTEFNEVTWLYATEEQTLPDRYVSFNVEENHWTLGTISWTTWLDAGLYANIITTGSDRYLYDNEVPDLFLADSSVMHAYVESGDLELPGSDMMFVDRFIPDMEFDGEQSPQAFFYFTTKKYPAGAATTKGPYGILEATSLVNPRLRGRQLRIKIASSTEGWWRMGVPRLGMQPDGRR